MQCVTRLAHWGAISVDWIQMKSISFDKHLQMCAQTCQADSSGVSSCVNRVSSARPNCRGALLSWFDVTSKCRQKKISFPSRSSQNGIKMRKTVVPSDSGYLTTEGSEKTIGDVSQRTTVRLFEFVVLSRMILSWACPMNIRFVVNPP